MPVVVLPCLNEVAALSEVLGGLPAGYQAVLADNESDDGSAELAAALGAVVVQASPKGFGAACHAGLLAARELAPADGVVCFADADGSLDLRQLPRVADPVLAGSADLVLARRRPTARGAWPAHARLGNAVLARTIRRRTGYALHDLGPMRACRIDRLVGLGLTDRRFGYPLEMVIRASSAGWRVREVEVDYLPRTGRSKVTGTVPGTVRAVRDMRRVLREL